MAICVSLVTCAVHLECREYLQQPVSAPVGYLRNLFSNGGGGGNSLWEWNVQRPASVCGGSGISISTLWNED